MGESFVLFCVGLIICFGGIYFRKIVVGLIGLIWGIILGVIISFMTMMSGGMYASGNGDSFSFFLMVLIIAIMMTVLSVMFEDVCIAISVFFSSLLFSLMILFIVFDGGIELTTVLLIGIIIAIGLSILAFKYHENAFIIATAFSGAYLASIGLCGMFNASDLADTLSNIIFYGESTGLVSVTTIGLGIAGFYVQKRRLINFVSDSINPNTKSNFSSLMNTMSSLVGSINVTLPDLNISIIKDKIVEYHQLLGITDENESLQETLQKNKFLLIFAVIIGAVLPFIIRKLSQSIYLNANGDNYDRIIQYNLFFNYFSYILEALYIGAITFVTLTKNLKVNIIYHFLYVVGLLAGNDYILMGAMLPRQTFWLLAGPLLMAIIIVLVSTFIKNNAYKPLIGTSITCFICYIAWDWLTYNYIYFSFMDAIASMVFIGTSFLLFKKYYDKNIFLLNS